jgi:hypothetical protein
MNIVEAPVKVIKDLVTENTLKQLQAICLEEYNNQTNWCNTFNRKAVHNHSSELIRQLHLDFNKLANEISGFDLKPSYTFMSLYGKNGYCPPHFDRPQCQYTIDLQINSDGLWPIYVKSGEYILENNNALCYSGTYHFHYRRKMPENMSFNHLIFFHYVPQDFQGNLN